MKENDVSNPIPYELIIEEFEGTLSIEDSKRLALWRASSAANEQTYHELSSLKDNLELLSVYKNLDPDSSWKNFKYKIDKSEEAVKKVIPMRRDFALFTRLAAAAILLIVSLFLIDRFYINPENNFATAENEHKKIRLPDGTEIFMNENTEVNFSKKDFKGSRIVNLIKGEAFFNVIHQEHHPFLVKLGAINLNDIGTSFNIVRTNKTVSIVVSTGKVSLERITDNKKIILHPNDKGIFNVETKEIARTSNQDANYKSWMDKKFTFRRTPLSEVARKIEKSYGIVIIFKNDDLKDRILTGSYEKLSADSIMRVISLSLHIKSEKRNGKFILKN